MIFRPLSFYVNVFKCYVICSCFNPPAYTDFKDSRPPGVALVLYAFVLFQNLSLYFPEVVNVEFLCLK